MVKRAGLLPLRAALDTCGVDRAPSRRRLHPSLEVANFNIEHINAVQQRKKSRAWDHAADRRSLRDWSPE